MSNKIENKEVNKKIAIKFILSKKCKAYIESEICKTDDLMKAVEGIKCTFNTGMETIQALINSKIGDSGVILTRTHDGELYLQISPVDKFEGVSFYAPSHLFLSVVECFKGHNEQREVVGVCVSPTFLASLKPEEVVVVTGYVDGLPAIDVDKDVMFDNLRWS